MCVGWLVRLVDWFVGWLLLLLFAGSCACLWWRASSKVCFGFMLLVDALCVCATSVRVRLRLEVFVGLFVRLFVCLCVC